MQISVKLTVVSRCALLLLFTIDQIVCYRRIVCSSRAWHQLTVGEGRADEVIRRRESGRSLVAAGSSPPSRRQL
ncbi:hypothetical protein EYF80_008533 [Liparis tanakae]|uniref:Secreted protein n=1 Tax=Liparis tanakae TaxID=230148 RepID=A0A4Z2IT66_9TELE|nr:hypothetical protein EYF80_008533 [Liparis tanakae]